MDELLIWLKSTRQQVIAAMKKNSISVGVSAVYLYMFGFLQFSILLLLTDLVTHVPLSLPLQNKVS